MYTWKILTGWNSVPGVWEKEMFGVAAPTAARAATTVWVEWFGDTNGLMCIKINERERVKFSYSFFILGPRHRSKCTSLLGSYMAESARARVCMWVSVCASYVYGWMSVWLRATAYCCLYWIVAYEANEFACNPSNWPNWIGERKTVMANDAT